MRIVLAFSIVCASVVGPAEAGHYRSVGPVEAGHYRSVGPAKAEHDGNTAAQQEPAMVDTPTVKVLTGLTVQEFEAEMQLMTQALGLSCGSCHARGNFASDANPRKLAARRMLEMTRAMNKEYFPDYKPLEAESRLGRVTCFTCHQGDTRPKTQQ